jgi:DNA-binding transcriptional regulator GbsR (MarR family)
MYEERAVILDKIDHLEERIEKVQSEIYKDEYLGENYHRRCIELERLEERLARLYELLCKHKSATAEEELALVD